MSEAVYTMRRIEGGCDAGDVRVRAGSIRAAFARIRDQRPAYAHDRLICYRIEEGAR